MAGTVLRDTLTIMGTTTLAVTAGHSVYRNGTLLWVLIRGFIWEAAMISLLYLENQYQK